GENFDGTPVCRDSSEAVRIHFYQRPVADAGEDITACGNEHQLDAQSSGAFHGVWSSNYSDAWFHYNGDPDDTLPNDSVYIQVLSYDQNPNYYEFYWQEDSGWDIPNFECADIDTVKIIFAPRPTGNFFHKIPACWSYEATVWADLSDVAIDVNTSVFNWDFGNNVDSVFYAGGDTTGYGQHEVWWDMMNHPDDTLHIVWLQVENEFGCKSFKHYDTIAEPHRMDPGMIITPASCGLANGSIILSTDNNKYTFTWVDDRLINPTDTIQPGLFGGQSGYLLALTAKAEDEITYPNVWCYDTLSLYIPDTGYVTALFDTSQFVWNNILSPPVADYDSIVPAVITLIDRSSGEIDRWLWRFYDENGDVATFLDENGEEETETTEQWPVVTFMNPGVYSVKLYIEGDYEGCYDEYSWGTFYIVGEALIEVPNVFTPNNDGKNDMFRPYCRTIATVHGLIFNRWGKKVYEWDWVHTQPDHENGWDGKVGTRDAAPGVYMYIIEATGIEGTEFEPIKGTVTLVRDR
ncbi:MAG: gliding motility-associated C-terminal domain-containing protein, partial [Bacteroidetes bacterium]|nr:gliding motility-associated C-terminal domain-containing protein [Bacteroidota bacterium]